MSKKEFKAAREANEQLANVKVEGEKLLAQAREEQHRILSEAAATRDRIIKDAQEKAFAEGNRLMEEMKKQIETEKESAIRDIRRQVAVLSVGIAEKIMTMATGTYSSMLRSTGDALTPGLINPTRTMVVAGRSFTVWGAGWGVPGAALGTALATAIGGLCALGFLLLREGPLCIRKPGSWKITRSCLRNLWRVGAPLSAERAALSSAQVLLIRIVSGLGTTAIAANSLGVSAESLCYMAGYGVQDASLAMVGQAVGAHRRDMAKRIAWLCTGMGMAIMALTGVGLYVFAPALMGIFTADAAVIALGAQVLRIEAFAEPMFGASIVASGAMQGAGDSTGCFVLNLVSMWGIRLTLAVLLAPRFGLVGVWFAMCAELCTRGALFLLRLARGKWLDKGALA